MSHPFYLPDQPMIMGILNVTPDSFSDGARYRQFDNALKHAEAMLANGVDIIDIGGESTRPGAELVTAEEELNRVLPLITELKRLGACVSVDTSKAVVMKAAAEAGVDMINDVRALSLPGSMAVVAEYQLPVCLMHMQGQPDNMQNAPSYQSVVSEVKSFLRERIDACVAAGIERSLISVDPGFGFGKTLQHNLDLLTQLNEFHSLDVPLLIGLSRKSMIGQVTGRDVDQRLAGSLAGALIAMQQGAKIIRVHDVQQTVDVKSMYLATRKPLSVV